MTEWLITLPRMPDVVPVSAAAGARRDGGGDRRRPRSLTHLQRLEAESIHIMREVVAECERPVMLYSIGKDSAVMLHLARQGLLSRRRRRSRCCTSTPPGSSAPCTSSATAMARELGMQLLVHVNREGLARGHQPVRPRLAAAHRRHEDPGAASRRSTSTASTPPSAARGATRRRAAPRSACSRSAPPQHRWDPKKQRPELWSLYNTRKRTGREHAGLSAVQLDRARRLAIHPAASSIPIVPLYFAAPRPVVERDGTLIMVDDERLPLRPASSRS